MPDNEQTEQWQMPEWMEPIIKEMMFIVNEGDIERIMNCGGARRGYDFTIYHIVSFVEQLHAAGLLRSEPSNEVETDNDLKCQLEHAHKRLAETNVRANRHEAELKSRIAELEALTLAQQGWIADLERERKAIQERARELLSTTPELGNYGLLNVAKFLRDDLVSGTFAEKGKNKVPDIVKCGWCGYEGRGERTTSDNGLSAPWCRKCGKNDKLTPVASGAFTGRDTDAE